MDALPFAKSDLMMLVSIAVKRKVGVKTSKEGSCGNSCVNKQHGSGSPSAAACAAGNVYRLLRRGWVQRNSVWRRGFSVRVSCPYCNTPSAACAGIIDVAQSVTSFYAIRAAGILEKYGIQ